MSHYAKVLDGKVVHVIVAEASFFDTFVDSSPGQWVQTSYNTRGNVHYGPDGEPDGGVALRGNYAGIGYTYDDQNDVFYAPSPFPSWVLDQNTWMWDAPTPYPTDGNRYFWDEPTTSWKVISE
ncbi:hypothetical protein UFOVP95_15 [uncultured Caudovirales phage]|uniref:Uncharacterized protein n=1 Tax=uncultured Caudovirales phage TaxID=2100421 RepID=A0A6J5L1R6_9CAUD|nr:hypothetical protein UFOVP95_15 [uncultured Caudovirales phage]